MTLHRKYISFGFGLVLSVAAAAALAGPEEDQARSLLQKNQDAVIAVQLVVKQQFSMMGMPSQDNESKSEVIGTVIGPDGLTVLSLTSTDPMGMFESMMGGMGEGLKVDSQITDVKLILPSGEELQAGIILRDKDLDLAFARPKTQPAQPLPYIDLAEAAEPQIMDRLIALARLGKVAQRVPAASLDRVEAVVTKPRTFYVPSSSVNNARLGSPAFSLDGKPVGVFVMRVIKDVGGGDPMGMLGIG
ncbi:MAG: trypsin-like peptidase domain-containing protein, partial [Candidatus Hydrogenedentes bacterium]|nr:trypsin-like peptidase domain-containing protein [Candidatus Hydrogenedentota bacterium]